MATTRLQIRLTGDQTQQIKLAGKQHYGIAMSTPSGGGGGGNAYMSINTTEGWLDETGYIPRVGEFVIYSDRNVVGRVTYPGLKIGNGISYVGQLPFLNEQVATQILSIINDHIEDAVAHVTSEDREAWDGNIEALQDHIDDTNVHVTTEDKETWDENITNLQNHIDDDTVHVTSHEKELWNQKMYIMISGEDLQFFRGE